jgi:NADPH:quinone reductase-like Zn-dependent oxidoreductase
MLAAYASALNPEAPLDALVVGERPEPVNQPGWTTVQVRAASLNHHDLWTLRGVGISADRLPMILGCDAAGIDTATGAEVIVHSVINDPSWTGD